MRWKPSLKQRGWGTMAGGLRAEIGRAKQVWLGALQAAGDDPSKQPQRDSPIPAEINVFGVGAKELQEAICDGAMLLRARVMYMHAVAFPKDGQRRVV